VLHANNFVAQIAISRYLNIKYSCTFYVCCNSQPTIESSDGITFAPYNFGYPLQKQHFEAAHIDPSKNLWRYVHDMNAVQGEQHWQLAEAKAIQPVLKSIDQLQAPTLTVPIPKV
jgi:hypothetical protein